MGLCGSPLLRTACPSGALQEPPSWHPMPSGTLQEPPPQHPTPGSPAQQPNGALPGAPSTAPYTAAPLRSPPGPGAWLGLHQQPLCSAPPRAPSHPGPPQPSGGHSPGSTMGMGMAVTWGRPGSRRFVPANGHPSRATCHPTAPAQDGKAPGTHRGPHHWWSKSGARVCPAAQGHSPATSPSPSSPPSPLPWASTRAG